MRLIAAGVALGGGTGLVWRYWAVLKHSLVANLPGSMMIVGGLGGLLIGVVWLAFARLPLRVNSIKLSLSGAEVQLSPHDAPMLWRFFVELASRVATQPLGDREGLVEEALASYYRLFDHARNDLASRAPLLYPGQTRQSPRSYVLQILNIRIRPLLARWHPRLERWKRTGLPEHLWPLEPLCRRDIEATRQQVLAAAWELGEQLGVAGLEQLLPPRPPLPLDARITDSDLAAAETVLPPEGEATRRQVGWKLYVEVAGRLPDLVVTVDSPESRQAFRETVSALADRLQQDLTTLPPIAGSLASGELEAAALRLIQGLSAVSARPDLETADADAFWALVSTLSAEVKGHLQAIGATIGWRA